MGLAMCIGFSSVIFHTNIILPLILAFQKWQKGTVRKAWPKKPMELNVACQTNAQSVHTKVSTKINTAFGAQCTSEVFLRRVWWEEMGFLGPNHTPHLNKPHCDWDLVDGQNYFQGGEPLNWSLIDYVTSIKLNQKWYLSPHWSWINLLLFPSAESLVLIYINVKKYASFANESVDVKHPITW